MMDSRLHLTALVLALTSITAKAGVAPGEFNPFKTNFILSDYKGMSYLQVMDKKIKPANDKLVEAGFKVISAAELEIAYLKVSDKVQGKVKDNMGGIAHLKKIANALVGTQVTMDTLPDVLKNADPDHLVNDGNKYEYAAFFGLVCGGGFAIEYAPGNYSLNVQYDDENQMSGRSFGLTKTRRASDASDKEYLNDLQAYSRGEEAQATSDVFFSTLFKTLLNNDSSGYADLDSNDGKDLLTDFLAVMTAEQIRNLMDDHVSPHWDAALLEVTLLSSFHAGQDNIKLYVYDRVQERSVFTDRPYQQKRCTVITENSPKKTASLNDYWQFSKAVNNTKNCRRSGINVTSKEFRKLASKITAYTKSNNAALFREVRESVEAPESTSNLYYALSSFLINSSWVDDDNPKKLSSERSAAIAKTWVKFLNYTKAEAKNITRAIEERTL